MLLWWETHRLFISSDAKYPTVYFRNEMVRSELVILLLLCVTTATANSFNLFLSQEEVKQLLGLENELFYVRDGKINEV